MFNLRKKIFIETDALDFRDRGMPNTRNKQHATPNRILFKKGMSPIEQNYETYDKELLVIVVVLRLLEDIL